MGTLRNVDKLAGVHPDLVSVITEAVARLDFDLWVVEGLRTAARQKELVKKGASQTEKSRHLSGHAVDVAPYVAGQICWDWPLYNKIAPVIKAVAKQQRIPIEWGGDWKSFKDGPHWQLPWKQYPLLRYSEALNDSVPDEAATPTPEEMPEKEKTLTQTGTFKGASIAGGATAVAGVSEIVKSVSDIKDNGSWLVSWLPLILSAIAFVGIAYLVYSHIQERKADGKS